MVEEEISLDEVLQTLVNGYILENYPTGAAVLVRSAEWRTQMQKYLGAIYATKPVE